MQVKKVEESDILKFSPCSEISYVDYYTKRGKEEKTAPISQEVMVPVIIDGSERGMLISSPQDIYHLAIGYVLAENLVPTYADIESLVVEGGKVLVKTTAEAHEMPAPPADRLGSVNADVICSYGGLLDSLSAAHHASHGVHEGALVRNGEVLAYAEDIGRHNVLDRLRGIVEDKKIDVSDVMLIFSGRVPQSVISKVHGMGVHLIASRALPSVLGLKLANEYGITVVCGLRPDSFRLYTHPERVSF